MSVNLSSMAERMALGGLPPEQMFSDGLPPDQSPSKGRDRWSFKDGMPTSVARSSPPPFNRDFSTVVAAGGRSPTSMSPNRSVVSSNVKPGVHVEGLKRSDTVNRVERAQPESVHNMLRQLASPLLQLRLHQPGTSAAS